MDDATLCKEVAEKVMGGHLVGHLAHGDEPYYSDGDGEFTISLSWDAAGLVIEKMRARGWKFSLACEATGGWTAIFWPTGEEFLSIDDTTRADTMPRAVFRAALHALGRL